jgi:3-carboxy-cis,cis-muconate cycloisomerase
LLTPLFRWSAIEAVFSDRGRLQAMLDFEAALARAEARAGVIPEPAAAAIAAVCRADRYDADALAASAARAGNLAIPLIQKLTALVGQHDPQAARFVHWGATSQDAIDTGLVLQLREALTRIESELERLADVLASLARAHRSTPMAGRTWLQQAAPTTFGLKAAGWLEAVSRDRARLAELHGRALVLQLGGPVGTLAALGRKGPEVAAALADELKLPLPLLAWHAQRDRVVEVAATLGLCAGTLGKIARDLALHSQTEVGELFEPEAEGRGGSSSLPHKRNPVASAAALAAAHRVPGLVASALAAMVQEDERGLGGWQAEWEIVPELVGLVGGALHHMTDALAGLRVDAARMRANLEATRGLVYSEAVEIALAGRVGRQDARRLVEAACRRARSEGRHLKEVLASDREVAPHLPASELEPLFDPLRALGSAERLVDGVLRRHDAARGKPAAS